jgi:hypothetical protein
MTTVSMSESFLDGMGLVESSNLNVKGKSFFDARTMDTGIGGPATSFANTNKVSGRDALFARFGPNTTLPVIARECPDGAAGLAGLACSIGGFATNIFALGPPRRRLASAMLAFSWSDDS